MQAVLDWWISLWDHGLIGWAFALIVAVVAVGVAALALVWIVAGLKTLAVNIVAGFREAWRSEPKDPHEELGVVDERPVDHR